MKALFLAASFIVLSSFTPEEKNKTLEPTSIAVAASFSLINDTKDKVSIHTGSGFVSLNKGSKTSISCNVGKEVRWAEGGKKGDVIFKISDDICGKTVKLSEMMK